MEFYKFVGAPDEETLLSVFDSIYHRGSMKFSAPHTFNDPFEFKYSSRYPENRAEFDRWVEKLPVKLNYELVHAMWRNMTSKQHEFIFTWQQRQDFLARTHILSLSQTMTNQLLWSHYTNSYTGFCAIISKDLIKHYSDIEEFLGAGPIEYTHTVPEVHWGRESYDRILTRIVLSKSPDWKYEQEFRIALYNSSEKPVRFIEADPSLMVGIILGARCPSSLRKRALELQKARPSFRVQELSAGATSFDIRTTDVEPTTHHFNHML
jgi:hypothetical protein